MAGHIQSHESSEKGKARKATLKRFGGTVDKIVDSMTELPREYSAYRAGLDPADADDALDIAYSDMSFDYSVGLCKPKFDMLSEDERAWLDRYLLGLGYVPVKE